MENEKQECITCGGYEKRDERIRKEFAKAFSWYTQINDYGYSLGKRELRLPTWEEIFVELGKKLSQIDVSDFEGNLSEIDVRLENLEKGLPHL